MASRLIWGARTTFFAVPVAIGSAFVVGGVAGLCAGWYGGWLDSVINRIGDVMLAFPALVLYIVLITSFGASLLNIVIAVTLAYAPGVARLMRGQVLALKPSGYVQAARAGGESDAIHHFVEILPNVGAPLVVDLCLRAGYTVILIGTLGFLARPAASHAGLGWNGRGGVVLLAFIRHMALLPAAAVSSVVIACNLLADGLRETGK